MLIALLGVGLAVYDAAKDAEDSKKETWSKKDERNAIGRDLLVSTSFIASEIAQHSIVQAEEDSYFIPFELFPECNIAPGNHVRGKIYS